MAIAEVLIIEPTVYRDDRGFLFEAFNLAEFEAKTAVARPWVQDNHSQSVAGVLRGIHFQNPTPQGKLVRCVAGAIWDVAVDLRRSSPTFGRWVGEELSAENKLQLWIPEGFGHGFVVLGEVVAEVVYKTTAPYVADADRAVRWDDPTLAIEWPIDLAPLISAKDAAAPLLADADLFD